MAKTSKEQPIIEKPYRTLAPDGSVVPTDFWGLTGQTPRDSDGVRGGGPPGQIIIQQPTLVDYQRVWDVLTNNPLPWNAIQKKGVTFDYYGLLKSETPLLKSSLDPRIFVFNGGRKFEIFSATGPADGLNQVSTLASTVVMAGAGAASDGSDSDGESRIIATSVAVGSAAECYATGGASHFQSRFGIYMYGKFKLRESSGQRWCYGFGNGDLSGADNIGTAGTSAIYFRYSSGAGDSAFQFITADGASQTIIDTGITVAAGTPYEFEVWSDGVTAYGRINNGSVFSQTATLPASTLVFNRRGMATRSTTAGVEYGTRCYGMAFSQN